MIFYDLMGWHATVSLWDDITLVWW